MADTSFNAIKLIPFDHYLVRPMMLRGESLRGFVYRFYDANGLKVPKMVSTQITHLSTVEVERQATRGAQKYLIGADVNLSEYDFFNQYVVVPKKRKKFRSDNFAQHRFCPACLNEKFTHYAVWDLPMFTACPKHFCRLVSLCEQCKLAFKWLTLDVKWQCRCKFSFNESHTQPASAFEIHMSKVILNAMDIPKASIYLDYIDQEKSKKYTLNDFFEALKWASKFKQILKMLGNQNLMRVAQQSINVSELNFSDYKVLLKKPVLRHCQKLLKKLSNQNKSIVSHLKGFSNLSVLYAECTYLTVHDNPFTRHLIPIFQIFIREYLNQLERELTVYLNTPRHTISKPFSLPKFFKWWQRVMFLIAKRKKTEKRDETKILAFRGYIDEAIEDIFRLLIKESQISGSELAYSKLFKSWNFPESLKTTCGFESILTNLDSYLISLHPYDLIDFYDLLDLSDPSAQEKFIV